MGVKVKQMCRSLGGAEVGSTFSVGQERGAQMHCVVPSRSYYGSAAMSRSDTGLVARPGNTSLSVVIPCKSWETMGVPIASRKMSPCAADGAAYDPSLRRGGGMLLGPAVQRWDADCRNRLAAVPRSQVPFPL